MKHVWLKLLTSILWSQKFRSLPDNDHRMVYIGMLVVTKLGLENEPFRLLAALFFVTERRYKTIRVKLISCGLLDADGSVKGFEDTQLTTEARRQRAKRSRDNERDMSRDNCPDSRSRSRSKKEEGDTRARAPAREAARPPRAETHAKTQNPDAEESVRACLHLVAAVKRSDPAANVPAFMGGPAWDRWQKAMLRIREVDGRTWADIYGAIDYAVTSPFWASNVIDPTRLRRHITAITVERNGPRGRGASARTSGKLGPMMAFVESMLADDAPAEAIEAYIAGVPAEFRDRLTAHAEKTAARLAAAVAEAEANLSRAAEYGG